MSTATDGSNRAIEPSLSSTSLTNTSPAPTSALAKGSPVSAKFFITAPFMTVGLRPARCRIQAIMPVTVDFPLVPATPMLCGAALNRSASTAARLMRRAPAARAATDIRHSVLHGGGGDKNLLRTRDPAAVLRVQPDATPAQIVELGAGAAPVECRVECRVERPVRPFHPMALGL